MNVRTHPYGLRFVAAALLVALTTALPQATLAQGIINGSSAAIAHGCDFATGRLTSSCIPWFIGQLVVFVFQFISVLFLINVMYAGYQLAQGSLTGDKGKGKDRLTWSIVGLIVSVCSFLILDLVLNVLLGS